MYDELIYEWKRMWRERGEWLMRLEIEKRCDYRCELWETICPFRFHNRYVLQILIRFYLKSVIWRSSASFNMGSLYRSEPMKLCQMIIAKESCYDIVGQLGKLNNVQFNDVSALSLSWRYNTFSWTQILVSSVERLWIKWGDVKNWKENSVKTDLRWYFNSGSL